MRIVDVAAYSVAYPAEYIFSRGADDPGTGDYFLRPGFPTVYSSHVQALLVRIETDTGLVGWGEALAPVVAEAVATVVARLVKPMLLGADPRDGEVLWNRIYDAMRVRGHLTGMYVDAIAAVDVALWDLHGQAVGEPIWRLMGGRNRERVEVYWSGVAGSSPDEVAANAARHVADGFRAVKLQLGHGREDLATFEAVRAAVGSDVGIALDAHWHYSVADAIAAGRRLERLGALFFEAPIAPEDVDGHAELCAALDVPIAIGEGERTRWQFLRLLRARAIDVAQPDIGRTGLTEARRIATLCEAHNVPIAPHVSTGLGVRFAATLHYAAALSNFLIMEYQGKLLDAINASLIEPIRIEGSQVAVPDGPGLGVKVNEAALAPYWRKVE
jgi:L-alanine-DL-glutamate epimerase-like enolase superfamily enzyme